jgi:formylmethanofuran dehydrogenase subunit B
LNSEAESNLFQIPQIIVSTQAASFAQSATVAIVAAPFPISTAGTIFRMDGISLPLPLAIPTSVPAEFAVLSQFVARLPPV